ncbi:hypothetical protein HYW35_02125 [Candidatus Saccharibacteria bacterium]|nr:hypothetical protein [Candidatus Saccharibacteria bacterium]
MMNRRKILILVILAGLAAGGAIILLNRQDNSPPVSNNSSSSDAEKSVPPSSSIPPPGPLVASPKIVITAPKKGAILMDGTKIAGSAQSSDGKLYVIVKGSRSGVLTDYSLEITPSSKTNQAFSFEIILEKSPKTGETLYLELYTMADGAKAEATDLELIAG